MRNMDQLEADMDSVDYTIRTEMISVYSAPKNMFTYYTNKDRVTLPEEIKIHKFKRDSTAFAKNDTDPAVINSILYAS